jgi:DNA polymerase I-like protein with 3'-5' exonuclease and polymerase domains
LLLAGGAYPNFRAVGTKSGRLSGTDGLNFQGVEASLDVRDLFILAEEDLVLSGGDYSSQELAIAGTTMADDRLLEDLKAGKSLHGLFGAELFNTTYEDIMTNKSTDSEDRYGRAKSAVYLTLYGGTFATMAINSNVNIEVAEAAFTKFCMKYPGVAHSKKVISERFSAIQKDIDSGKLVYRDPPIKYIESIFGFRRHFDTEFGLQRLIFDLAQNIPEEWKQDPRQIKRDRKGERVQTMAGAICSALYGAAYSVQNGVIRASNNHLIQSAGRTITVGLQQKIWELQPVGIHEFVVKPMSIHDEIAAVTKPEAVEPLSKLVKETLDDQCERIPLLALEWGRHLKSWGDLKIAKMKTHDMVACGFQL